MARSRRNSPGCGWTTAASDKPYKQQEHRRERAAVRSIDLTAKEPPASRAFGNPWHGEKDGKQWFDPERHPKEMRK
ncbi:MULTISPECIES: hypothetical protein [unclassified Aurantimonas]|uniref:hypothetical protein n=1 Tax=unclassified Aurantimonas TaxID=2638230 RepID=UPI002E17CA5B|nr:MULTISPECIES: hypothetical protein [unclassified Aurantimonas]MEC5292280.1 hypothetical protein [Aurantimonas sp. C2-3-R2]MEC5413365.1 hypothetical protein [Aurantimonas sp. C2-4-R8]